MPYRTIVVDPPWPYEDTERSWAGNPKWTNPMLPYRSMSLEQIAALPVGDIAAPDAHLYLWTTQRFLRAGYDIAEAWGFVVERTLTWCKKPMGKTSGGAFCNTSEFFLYCRRNMGPLLRRAREARGISAKDLCSALGAHGAVNHGGAVSNWEQELVSPPEKYWSKLRTILGLDGPEWDELAGRPRMTLDSTWFLWPRGAHSQKPEHFYDLVEQISPAPYVDIFARRHRLGWDVWGNQSANTLTRDLIDVLNRVRAV